MHNKVNLLIVVNDPAFFVSHRLPLARRARQEGFEVHVATGPGERVHDIEGAGLHFHRLPLQRSGRNPLQELRLLVALLRLYRRLRPELVHLVTIKPLLYGGLIARLYRIPGTVSAVSGMGYLFTGQRKGFSRRFAESLYRLALRHRNSRVIVQNETDRARLYEIGALREGHDVLIPGSGADLDFFQPAPLPKTDGPPLVVLPARMLWDKGIGEFVEAARQLAQRGIEVRCALVGGFDDANPARVPHEQLTAWQEDGIVEWWGHQHDIAAVYAQAHLVVLPSFYGEGLPKALIEAAACGRAIITTDHPGCREVVDHDRNGYLVPIKDPQRLAEAMAQLISDRERLEAFGRYSRRKAEREFGQESVIDAHLDIYQSLLDKAREQRR